MKRWMIALALAAVPSVASAQDAPLVPRPLPLPGRDTLAVPPVALLLPAPQGRAEAVVAGAVEGAAFGAAYGAALAQYRPECAPSSSPARSAARSAAFGGVWGAVRALFGGRRQAPIRTVAANDRAPDLGPRPTPGRSVMGEIASEQCIADVRPATTPSGRP